MTAKPPKAPTGRRPSDVKKVVPLRERGPLSPGFTGSVSIGFGIDGDDFIWRNPDGSIERTKLTDDDDT